MTKKRGEIADVSGLQRTELGLLGIDTLDRLRYAKLLGEIAGVSGFQRTGLKFLGMGT